MVNFGFVCCIVAPSVINTVSKSNSKKLSRFLQKFMLLWRWFYLNTYRPIHLFTFLLCNIVLDNCLAYKSSSPNIVTTRPKRGDLSPKMFILAP